MDIAMEFSILGYESSAVMTDRRRDYLIGRVSGEGRWELTAFD